MAVESFKVIGLEGVLKTLRELGPAAAKNGGPIRSALRKAAVVVQKQVVANLEQIIREDNEGEKPTESTGLLAKNIAITRSKPAPGQKGERFLVRVRNKAYAQKGKKPRSTAQIARLLEGGSERMKAHPFFLPAFDATKQQAVNVIVSELPRAILSLQKRLAKKNGVKP